MAKPEDFFLPEKSGGFDEFRGPLRSATALQPITDGQPIFEGQEEAIFAAKKSVFIGTWAFNPRLAVSSRALPRSLPTWGHLLLHMAGEKKVQVNILTTDFDPMFQVDKHFAAWISFAEMAVEADRRKIPEEKVQMVIARHEAEWSPNVLLKPLIQTRYDAILAALNTTGGQQQLKFMPGLWDRMKFNSGAVEWVDPDTIFPVLVGSVHQKIVIIDGKLAYVSGINHVGVNLDNRAHTLLRRIKKWHDGSVRVTGEVVDDIVRSAFLTWNDQRVKAAAFQAQANKAQPRMAIAVRGTTDLVVPKAATPANSSNRTTKAVKPKPKGPIPCQMWRTMSRKIDANDQPDTSCADILEGHVRAIGLAEKFIYIENQYLRDGTIGQALVDRMSAVKDLNLILVLPAVSEEMMESADPISLTGVALQFKIIEKLLAFGDRFGAFAMLAPLDPPTKKGDPKIDVIYVHNKLMIVDDVFAVAGSANLNERGTKLDFELDLAWHSPKSVKALRVSLWTEILGKDAKFSQWKPAAYAKSWSDLATKNAGRAPTKRKGFVMPLTNEEGFDLPLVPNWLAQTGDPGRGALRIAGLA